MAVKQRRGKEKKQKPKGAAANYITRTQAIKKLQCSLADFRRLCILKGIFPREPRSRKKANSGSSAPTTFYYAKDIQYLLHEPILGALRQHKTFAKKLSRAIGRNEWALAKNLDDQKPTYQLDHVIKERYPTFEEAIRDLDDALSLVYMFSRLPATGSLQASVVEHCGRLAAQWQLYVLRTHSLRKVFLSIKGVYFQAEIKGQPVTWLVPYQFTQHVPSDVDFRIMLTFIELYQTLMGFVFYKLYSDVNLVYPPKLEQSLDDQGADMGAFFLEETSQTLTMPDNEVSKNEQVEGDFGEKQKQGDAKNVSAKRVKQEIKSMVRTKANNGFAEEMDTVTAASEPEIPVNESTTTAEDDGVMMDKDDDETLLFEKYFFYLSREVTRPTLEFVIRSFGGQVGWDYTLGGRSPFTIDDPRITHFVVDRPVDTTNTNTTATATATATLSSSFRFPSSSKCAHIQPQWVVDCVNLKRLLPTGEYAPGKTLPPHLSPFVDSDEARRMREYVPDESVSKTADEKAGTDDESDAVDDDEEKEEEMESNDGIEEPSEEDEEAEEITPIPKKEQAKELTKEKKENQVKSEGKTLTALEKAARNPEDEGLKHSAELEAEARGINYGEFVAELERETRKVNNEKKKKAGGVKEVKGKGDDKEREARMNRMLLTGKQRKLYNKMSYSRDRRTEEKSKLERKRKEIEKRRKRGEAR